MTERALQPDPSVPRLLEACAAGHRHACPRQVLGVRIGLLGGRLLGIALPQAGKRLLTFVETDGCCADGVAVATGCRVGRRTLRVVDYGKVAATFVDRAVGRAVRIWPHPCSRQRAQSLVPDADSRWEAMRQGYQRLPDEALLAWSEVELVCDLARLWSRPGARVLCESCGEEIINEREVRRDGAAICRWCAEGGYYRLTASKGLPESVRPVETATSQPPTSASPNQ